MRKLSRRQKENLRKTENILCQNLEEAIDVLKDTATAKFVETVELHANLNIDPKYADQQLRTTITLPHGLGKSIKIAVLTNDANFDEANTNGADIVAQPLETVDRDEMLTHYSVHLCYWPSDGSSVTFRW